MEKEVRKLREELKRSSTEQSLISKTLREKSKVWQGWVALATAPGWVCQTPKFPCVTTTHCLQSWNYPGKNWSIKSSLSMMLFQLKYSYWFVCVCVFIHSVMSDSLWPHGLYPARLLCPFSRLEYWNRLPFLFQASQLWDWTHVSCISWTGRKILTSWAARKTLPRLHYRKKI